MNGKLVGRSGLSRDVLPAETCHRLDGSFYRIKISLPRLFFLPNLNAIVNQFQPPYLDGELIWVVCRIASSFHVTYVVVFMWIVSGHMRGGMANDPTDSAFASANMHR